MRTNLKSIASSVIATFLCLSFSAVQAADPGPVKSKLGYEAISVAPADAEEGAKDTTIRKDGKEITRVPNAKPVSFSPDGKVLLLCEAAPDDSIRHILLNVAGGEKPKPFGKRHQIGDRFVVKVEWSKDGKSLTFTYHKKLSEMPSETITVAEHLNKGSKSK